MLPKDQYATPANAYDIARAMHLLLEHGHSGIFHIGGTDFMNRVELAQTVLQFFPEAKYQLTAITTESLNQPAKRPLIGGFVSKKFKDLFPEFLFGTVASFVAEKA